MRERVAVALVVAAAAGQAIAFRDSVYSDGVAYLDLSDAILAGRWGDAVNGLWSPLYPALLAVARWIGGTGAEREVWIAHAVNFVVFLAALAASRAFARAVRLQGALPVFLFGWAALDLARIAKVGPDLLVLAAALLAGSLALARAWAPLGIVLGAGYYAKAAVFPIAIVFFAASVVEARRARQLRLWAAGVAVFAAVTAPLLIAVSRKTGTIAFSDAGRLNYLWHVNGLPDAHWRGEGSLHPTRELLARPEVYEFASPVGGTYPVWFDPSYWYAGARPRWSTREQAAACGRAAARMLRDLFWSRNGVIVWPLAVALAAARLRRAALARLAPALIPAAAAIAMFLCIHVETRYIAPFVLMLAVGALAAGNPPAWAWRGVAIIAAAWLIVVSAVTLVRVGWEDRIAPEAARAMSALGARPGDAVFVVGNGWTAAAWARRARVRITGEAPDLAAVSCDGFWRAVEKTGARFAVADAEVRGWRPLGATGLYARRVP